MTAVGFVTRLRAAVAPGVVAAVVLAASGVGHGAPRGQGSPLPAPIAVSVGLHRTTAASGQSIVVTGAPGPCVPDAHPVVASLHAGTALGAIETYPIAAAQEIAAADGSFAIELRLLRSTGDGADAPLPEGEHTLVAWCSDGLEYVQSAPQVVTVVGQRPSQDVDLTYDGDAAWIELEGGSCPDGEVTVTMRAVGDEFPGDEHLIVDTVVPAADGSWSHRWDGGRIGPTYVLSRCGDPTADGFWYRTLPAWLTHERPGTTTTTAPTATTESTSTSTATVPDELEVLGVGTAEPAAPIAGNPSYTG